MAFCAYMNVNMVKKKFKNVCGILHCVCPVSMCIYIQTALLTLPMPHRMHCVYFVPTWSVLFDVLCILEMCMQLVILFFVCFLGFLFGSVLFCSVLLFLLYGKFRLRAVSLTCSNHFPLIEYFFSFCSFFTSSSFSCSRICCVQKTLFVLLSLSCSLSIAFGRARFRSSCYFSSLFVVFSSFQFDHVLLFLIYMLKQFFFLLFFSLLFLFSL